MNFISHWKAPSPTAKCVHLYKTMYMSVIHIVHYGGLVIRLCQILCDLMDCNPPSSSIHEIFQARILEWVAISFSGDLPHPGIEPGFLAWQADSLPTEPPGKPQGEL